MTNATPPPAAAPLSPDDDKLWASLSHFLNIIPLIPAIIIFVVFRGRGPRVTVESKEALNWTINVTGIVIIAQIVAAIIGIIPIIGGIIAVLIGIVIWVLLVVNLIFAIIGGVRVQGGGSYKYPVNYYWVK